MKEYKIRINGEFDFVIVFPGIIGSLISKIRENEDRELLVGIDEVMPEQMTKYLLNVINTNRYSNGRFRFQQIIEDPIKKMHVYKTLQSQLEYMDFDGQRCFDKMELVEILSGESGLDIECAEPFYWACKDAAAEFLYTFADGRKETIIIEY